VGFFDQFCRLWTPWRLTWGWREKQTYRRGDPYSPSSVEREDRVTRAWHEYETGDPPPRLRDAPRLLDALSGAVQRFGEESAWTFESMEQADEVARRLLTVAQSIESADYIRAAAQKPEDLGPLLKTAIRRRGPVRHPTRAARQISDGHGAGVSVAQTTPESCILERAVKAGAQHGQAAEAASPKPASSAQPSSNAVPHDVIPPAASVVGERGFAPATDPKSAGHLKPSHTKAKGLYEWAMEHIDGAENMTYAELFAKLTNDRHCGGEGLPNNAEAFARYCRAAGIQRNTSLRKKAATRSVRQASGM